MEPFILVKAVAAPFVQPADTDQIMPVRFLRKPRGHGYQDYLFHDLRFHTDGSEKPDFVLNQTAFRDAAILVTDQHFGAGSSREQALWGLCDYGIRCVIAPDFGEIFYENAFRAGLLPVQLDRALCNTLRLSLENQPGLSIKVDLPNQRITGPDHTEYTFAINPFNKRCLMEGLDNVGITLLHEAEISAFEQSYRKKYDWLFR